MPQDATQWQTFLTAIGAAHAADVAGAKGGSEKPIRSILFDNAHKPTKFTDDRDTKLDITFKQWSADVRSMICRYNKKHAKALDTAADRTVWNPDDVKDELIEDNHTAEEI